MRKLLKLLWVAFLLFPTFSHAAIYYVSPTGADSNPGSILQPFKTLTKASQVVAALPSHGAGDIIYVRDGIYNNWPNTPANGYAQLLVQNLIGTSSNWCTIMNYPGESPIFDYSNVVVTAARPSPTGLSIFGSQYLKVKGIRLTGYHQITTGLGVSRGIELNNVQHAIIEDCEIDHFQGTAFFISSASTVDVEYLNCDAHHNEDPLSADGSGVPGSDAWDNADGFGITGAGNNATAITFTGCRAWLNCDDGWDNIFTNGVRTWVNCQAFLNGYYQRVGMPNPLPAGNGNGFKLGSTGVDALSISTQRVLKNCIAFDNRANGFDQNGTPTTGMTLYNCTAYRNSGYGFQFQYYPVAPATVAHLIKNCNALSNGSGYGNLASAIPSGVTNNSWQNGLIINSSDFTSLDTAGMSAPRPADGSLPATNFLHLVSGSDLRNAGTPVGIPFCDSDPDLGAYEFCTAPDVPPTVWAGPDQIIQLPISSVVLAGQATGVATVLYNWSALDGGTISNTAILAPTVTALTNPLVTYRFVLRVTDGNGIIVRDTMQVTVQPAGGTVVPTGVIIRSVTTNRLNNGSVTFDADVTTNSKSFNVQRKTTARGAVYSTIGSIAAVMGTKSYTGKYSLKEGWYVRACPVDKQGVPPCSAGVLVKKK